jgi:hypothetical protein
MGIIRNRIIDEHRKHGQKYKDIDWARIAEIKILGIIEEELPYAMFYGANRSLNQKDFKNVYKILKVLINRSKGWSSLREKKIYKRKTEVIKNHESK